MQVERLDAPAVRHSQICQNFALEHLIGLIGGLDRDPKQPVAMGNIAFKVDDRVGKAVHREIADCRGVARHVNNGVAPVCVHAPGGAAPAGIVRKDLGKDCQINCLAVPAPVNMPSVGGSQYGYIARSAGISRPLVYRSFNSKVEILAAL